MTASTDLVVIGAAVLAAALVMAGAAVWCRRLKRIAVVDAAWGLAFALVALVAGVTARAAGAPGGWLVVAMVVVWGARLAWHLGRRVLRSDHDDPRYEQMLGGRLDELPFGTVVRKVFLLQGAIVIVVAAPVLSGVLAPTRWRWAVAVGVVVWLAGFVVEAVADAQLARFRRLPSRPPLLTTGLWGWTRHPNYFGDACLWWGVWLVGGLGGGWVTAVASLIGPVSMTWFLVAVSGVALAERRMASRPGWEQYAARTSVFVPWPPRGA